MEKAPLSMLCHWGKAILEKIYLKQPIDDIWHTLTRGQTGFEIKATACTTCSTEVATQQPHWSDVKKAASIGTFVTLQ